MITNFYNFELIKSQSFDTRGEALKDAKQFKHGYMYSIINRNSRVIKINILNLSKL